MRKCLIGVFIAAVGAVTASASVTLTFSANSGSVENVLLNGGTTGNTVQGDINGNNSFFVNFTSTQVLNEPSGGQARVQTTGGLSDLMISLTNSFAFNELVFNAFIGGNVGTPGSGSVTVLTSEPGGAPNHSTVLTIPGGFSNGSNFITLTASGGEAIISAALSAPSTVADVRQVRIGGPFSQPTQQEFLGAPEPDTMLLLAAGLVGVGLLRRRTTA